MTLFRALLPVLLKVSYFSTSSSRPLLRCSSPPLGTDARGVTFITQSAHSSPTALTTLDGAGLAKKCICIFRKIKNAFFIFTSTFIDLYILSITLV